ncbi:hypothetical protein GCM10007940_47690 [Portibacter lacus]|uniref:Uncharacterized protein n=1 Tax=Portibacter lacus TaxID=1099794 RepID=A0AA37STE1_9BACT|nr:hypothetical protein GCM10007940_47690 [Portibacter lacus]
MGVGSTKSTNDYGYLTQGISLGFSSPLFKVNGRSDLDRRKDLQITKTKNK